MKRLLFLTTVLLLLLLTSCQEQTPEGSATKMQEYLENKYDQSFEPVSYAGEKSCWKDYTHKVLVAKFYIPDTPHPDTSSDMNTKVITAAMDNKGNICDDYFIIQRRTEIAEEFKETIKEEFPECKILVNTNDNFVLENTKCNIDKDCSLKELIDSVPDALFLDIYINSTEDFGSKSEKACKKLAKQGLETGIHLYNMDDFYEDFDPLKMLFEDENEYTQITVFNKHITKCIFAILGNGKVKSIDYVGGPEV